MPLISPTTLASRAARRLEGWPPLRRLDRLPFGRALLFGLVVGLFAAAGLLVLPDGARLVAAALLIAAAAAVAWSGQPVGVWQPAVVEKPELLDMVAIEGGTFWMGSPEGEVGRDDDETRHRVTLSPFWMGRTPVTRAQYREVVGLDEAPRRGSDDHPVTEISWRDAVAFCNRLSEGEGREPCYRIDAGEIFWVEDAGGYRLPTEAEWEYAARAGSETRWSFGNDESELGRHAWFSGNSDRHSHPVGGLKANPWGLHDMHGNVWEWCWDSFDVYPEEPVTDPKGRGGTPDVWRVVRGGSFRVGPRFLGSAFRNRDVPGDRDEDLGFRCVRRPVRQR